LAQSTPGLDDDALAFARGGGEMGRRMRDHDWRATPLGSPAEWPSELKTLLGLILVSSQPMFLAWGDARTWLYNDAFTPILGAKHPAALAQPAMDVWAEARHDLEPLFARVFAGTPVHMQDIDLLLDRNGRLEEAHFSFSYNPVHDARGHVVGLFGVCVETTSQVLANRALAAQRENFARLFEQAPTFMAMLRGPEHRFELANPRYMELIGNRPIIGRTVADALPDAVAQGYLELLDSVFRTGEPFSAFGYRFLAQHEPAAAIDERYVDFVYQPITDDAGRVTGIFVQGVDVTARESAQAELHSLNLSLEQRVAQRTAELRNIQSFYLHSCECHAVLALRDDGSFQYDEINPATLRLYGKSRDEVIGRTIEDVLGAQTAAELNVYLSESLRRDAPQRYLRRQGGRIVEATATPIPAERGQLRRLAVTARDITEQQHLEEQLRQAQKMEAVGQLTGGLAHDFNNLLGAIMGSLELIGTRAAQGRTQDVERYLGAALNASKRAAALTHRLLAFSRRQTLDARAVNINRLVTGMAELIRRTVGPQIDVEVVSASDLWLTWADAGQLENSLLNLCINARDAMPHGGRLTVETANRWIDSRAAKEQGLKSGQYISMCVSDTGSGMSPDVIARAFDPFFTTKPTGMGTGLGLSMVYGFAKQSGGQVRIYSEVGQGSMVCIYLPRLDGSDEIPEAEARVAPLASTGNAKGSILVVDDEANLRMVMSDVLSDLGYEVIEACDSVTALRVLDADVPLQLLITDVGLPGGMNGRQIADAARARRPKLGVLFVTGYAENAAIGNGFVGSGMQVLTKPFSIDDFVRRVKDMA
jgi:PAS domain S-box-containing protein